MVHYSCASGPFFNRSQALHPVEPPSNPNKQKVPPAFLLGAQTKTRSRRAVHLQSVAAELDCFRIPTLRAIHPRELEFPDPDIPVSLARSPACDLQALT